MKVIRILFVLPLFIFSYLFSCGQSWLWATEGSYRNDSATSVVDDLTTDNSGNIFQSGDYWGEIQFGNIYLACPHSTATYLVKFDHTGSPIWGVTVTNNGGLVQGFSIATDNLGNVCLTGDYADRGSIDTVNFPLTNYYNLYIAMFSSSGLLKWTAFSKGESDSSTIQPNSVTIDSLRNTYVTGIYEGYMAFDTFQFSDWENSSFFLTKFDTNGKVIWVITSKATQGGSEGTTAVTDAIGNIYVTGCFDNTLTIGSTVITTNGFNDVFLAKFNPSGNLIWITSANIPSSQSGAYSIGVSAWGRFLSIDNIGNLYLTGGFLGTMQFGPYTVTSKSQRIFLAKFSPSGNIIWLKENTLLNNHDTNYISFSIACDKHGSFYLGGSFENTIDFNSIMVTSDSNEPCFVFKFDTSGSAICGSAIANYNNNNADNLNVSADPLGADAFVSGSIWSGGTFGGCYFGNYYLSGSNTFPFIADWTCGCTSLLRSTTNLTNTTCEGCNDGFISVKVSGGTLPYTYLWIPLIDSGYVASNLSAGTYTITCTDYNGCNTSDIATIDVSCGDVFIPNVFSPNQAHNSILYVRGPCIQSLEFDVFDRWGNKVFESNNPTIGWDGNRNGTPMNMGTYMYYAKATMYDGSIIEKHGDVTLVR